MRTRTIADPSWLVQKIRRSATAIAPLALIGAVLFASLGSVSAAGATTPGWSVQANYPAPPTPDVVSCSALVCIAVGGSILATTDAGTTWTNHNLPAGVTSLDGVSCPSLSDCVAVGDDNSGHGVIVATTDGGTTWTGQNLPTGPAVSGLSGVSSASASDCVAEATTAPPVSFLPPPTAV